MLRTCLCNYDLWLRLPQACTAYGMPFGFVHNTTGSSLLGDSTAKALQFVVLDVGGPTVGHVLSNMLHAQAVSSCFWLQETVNGIMFAHWSMCQAGIQRCIQPAAEDHIASHVVHCLWMRDTCA